MVFKQRLLTKAELRQNSTLKKEKTRGSRWQVAVLFLGTILFSFIFWFKDRFADIWQNFNQPTVYTINKIPSKDLIKILGIQPDFSSFEGLRDSLNFLLNNISGVYGIYYYDLANNKTFGIREEEVFIAASVNKIPLMVSFYDQAEKGRLNLEATYSLDEVDIQDYGSGSMRYQSPGTLYRREDLITLMGKHSDNTAALVVEKMIGTKTIQNHLDNLGMEQTLITDNTTTPREMGDYLVKLYQGKLVSEKSKNKILEVLTDTDFEDRIPQGVPDYVKVAHKIGNEVQVYNDCGIILSSKPYVLCILSKEAVEDEALDVIPKISRLVWEYHNKN